MLVNFFFCYGNSGRTLITGILSENPLDIGWMVVMGSMPMVLMGSR